MEIRPLTVADAVAFWNLRLRGFQESPRAFNTDPDEWRTQPVAEIARLLAGESGTKDDVVLGAFAPALAAQVGLRREARRKRSHKATIWGLYVAPEVRGQGLGRRLIGLLLERARAMQGLSVVQLTVMAANTHASAIYTSLGFERFGYQRRAARDGDVYFDEEHLMLDLDV